MRERDTHRYANITYTDRKVVNDVAGRRNQKITYQIFYDGKPVDRLPDGYAEKASAAMSRAASAYIQKHPEKLATLDGKDYVEKKPIASGTA